MGGAEYQVKCLVDALVATGRYEVTVLTRAVGANYTPNGYKIVLLKTPFGVKRGRYFLDYFTLKNALGIVKPDIVYQRMGLAYTGFCARYARKSGCTFVWHIAHDRDVVPAKFRLSRSLVDKYVDKRILEYGIKYAGRIIAQTHHQADLLARNYSRVPAAVIRNFHPKPEESIEKGASTEVVWVGNLKPSKRPEVFLMLSEDLAAQTRARFTMIGPMQGGRIWRKKMSEQLRAAPHVEYLGYLSQEGVNSVLARAHILVCTSAQEGFPNIFIQAWMRRVPVVSLSVNPDQVLTKQGVGLLSGNYDQLRKDVIYLIDNPWARSEMAQKSERYALKEFSHKNVSQIYSLLG